MGNLDEQLCIEIANFIMSDKDDIVSYYFLNSVDETTANSIKSFLGQKDLRKASKRTMLLNSIEQNMLKFVPYMVLKCFEYTLLKFLFDTSTSCLVPNNMIFDHFTFPVIDYVAFISRQRVVSRYIACKSKEDLSVVENMFHENWLFREDTYFL